MGLLELLSNPQMIGMAMAGLSRDPDAPMNAMKSLGMVEDINQKRAELVRQEQERTANAGLLRALMAAQQQQGDSISDAYRSYGNYKTAPNQVVQPSIPNNLSGTATDLETGQSYNPAQVAPNMDKKALYQTFMDKLSALHKVSPMDLSQFAGASPAMQLAAMKQHLETKPADKLMEMIEKQNKPVILPEGSSAYTQDSFTGELTPSIQGKPKQTLDSIKAKIANGEIDPSTLSPEVQQMLGMTGKDRASQEKGITQSGYSVYWDPNKNIMMASKPGMDGQATAEPWDPKKHGQPMQNAMPFNLTVTPPESPSQKANFGMMLRKEFSSLQPVKDYRDVENKAAVMQAAYTEAKRTGSYVAADQALISLFNKLTDPQSVVRESEYARTGQNLAFIDKMRGWVQKQASGGAGLTDKDRQTLIGMSNQFLDINKKTYKKYEKDYSKFAQMGGVDPNLILFGEAPNYTENQAGVTQPPNKLPAQSSQPKFKILKVVE